jgi:DNA-binding IclR family transcriptional regulator
MTRAEAVGGDRELNKATVRVLAVLSSFASDVAGFGVTELSQLLGMTKNMTYRALTTLVEQGYLMRDGEGARYQLGFRILELQNNDVLDPDFRALCAPYLRRIQSLTGESVSLAVRALDYCVLIDGIETRKPGVWRVRVGDLLPLFAPASGRVMLAFSNDRTIEEYIAQSRPMRHPRTGELISPEELRRDIIAIRRNGFVRVTRASQPPMVSLSFAVRDLDGGLHGAISVGGPIERSRVTLEAHLPQLIEIVAELNSRTRLFSANAAGSELN